MDNTHAKLISDSIEQLAGGIGDLELTIRDFSEIPKALNRMAEAIERLAGSIAEDEPLSYSISRSLDKIANGIIYKDEHC